MFKFSGRYNLPLDMKYHKESLMEWHINMIDPTTEMDRDFITILAPTAEEAIAKLHRLAARDGRKVSVYAIECRGCRKYVL